MSTPTNATYETVTVNPMAGAIGAEIVGVDLSQPQPDAVWSEIRRAFRDRLVIVFRDQTLTPQQQISFAGRFGTPTLYPFIEGLEDAPEVIEILKNRTGCGEFRRQLALRHDLYGTAGFGQCALCQRDPGGGRGHDVRQHVRRL